MHSISKLQVGIYIGVIFIVLVVVFIFLGVIPGLDKKTTASEIVIWGTYPQEVFKTAFTAWREEHSNVSLTYEEKTPTGFRADILEALATGNTPDIILLPDSLLHTMQNKLAPVPVISMTEREYKETFASVTDIFLQNNQIYGVPFAIDPLVLYWNRDFFASETIALPPSTWDEFRTDAQRLTKRTETGNITRSGAAMGLTSNIPQAVDIVSLLALQGGISIIDPATHAVTIAQTSTTNQITTSPAETALRYYTDFSRREKTSYTWNYTFPKPDEAFAREDLAMFIGRASMFNSLSQRSPHINIGVSPVPQYSQAPVKIGYGRVMAFTVPAQSPKQTTAWQVAVFLSQNAQASSIADDMKLAPTRRDLLGAGHTFPPFSVFYEEALRARVWYDPDPARSSPLFINMIELVAAGRDAGAAVAEASTRLSDLLK
ncbi:MAG: hypothetical protein A3J54_03465 [Candidatus Ryanbacteria bacterium RIFCSPHIGHO2_02_FULL_45_13b]|uniref:Sugar ABC transporter substrate-binding protein n=1 Tax=Candidatus Ryanbacteria bacterium RIFCSPHIGHO2_02_FULL_45_13b TaxID=1802117 RepID=A0A1G2GAT1_9BACT|nr:MAG: hypothetical protein A3J54_03465 [Candidatus Ryanbacteria bacterium RIFCSPHIGHO2_02_FULL_45_13b]